MGLTISILYSARRGARSWSAGSACLHENSRPDQAGTATIRVKTKRTAMITKAKIHWNAITWWVNWATPSEAESTLREKPIV